jgi:hypothetical protein
MPRKKKTPPLTDNGRTKAPQIKAKTLFDHINAITQIQDKKYFEKLSESDKKTWSTYMINRFLSMNPDWIELISELDYITVGQQLKPELVYKMYIDIIPKSRIFLKYIKGKNVVKYNTDLIKLIVTHFRCSKREAVEYLGIYYSTEDRFQSLKHVISMYGNNEKEIKKLIKV